MQFEQKKQVLQTFRGIGGAYRTKCIPVSLEIVFSVSFLQPFVFSY